MEAIKLTIRGVTARAVVAPLKRPIRTAVGTMPSAPLVLIDVITEEGGAGRSYIFGYTPATLIPLVRLIDEIGSELKGKPVAPVERMREFDRHFRLVGWQGLIGMAVSGLDMAFWDAIARTLDQPLVTLLGGAPVSRGSAPPFQCRSKLARIGGFPLTWPRRLRLVRRTMPCWT